MGRHGQIAWIDALLKKAFSLKQRILLTSLTDTRSVSLHLSQFGAGVQWRDVLQASGVVFKMGAMRTALAAPRAESLRSRTENRHPLRRTCRWD